MTRVFHSELLTLNQEIELDDFAAQHLARVMRIKAGDKVNVFNSTGEYISEIVQASKKTVRALLIEKLDIHSESPLHTTLLQAVTRRERMDFSIQKATELGVNVIQPILTEHCVVKLDTKKAQQKLKHWQGIARHATEQSGRLSIPEIRPVCGFNESLKIDNNSLKLIFALSASKPLSELAMTAIKSAIIAIGPVGGFSLAEVTTASQHDFQNIKFGPRTLRSETATVAALTALQMRWGDLSQDV